MKGGGACFEDAQGHIAGKVEQATQGGGIGDVEIVAGDHAQDAAAGEQVAQVRGQQSHAAVHDEGNGGIDAVGNAYSSNLLGTSLIFNGSTITFGAANASDGVKGTGQTITLPAGAFSKLNMLGTGLNGNQASQSFVVTYSDGTTTTLTQSMSDWFTPQSYTNESTAKAMSYRLNYNGTQDNRTFNLYGYTLALNKAKTVKSIKLPNNKNVVILGMALLP